VCPHAQIQEDNTIRCVLVHDMLLLRQGLRRMLADEPDVEIIAEASNAAEALRQVSEHRPHVVITDTKLFGCPPDEAERMIVQESPQSSVIFLPIDGYAETFVSSDSFPPIKHAMRGTSVHELVNMVRSAVDRDSVPETSEIGGLSVEDIGTRKRVLTAREREVLKLLAEGKTVRSTASVLGLSVKTVDAHKFNLMRKLGIHNKAELVMWAIQKKVVKLPVNF
jgi:two-component system, NarL family, response regulator NreC